MNTEFRVRAKEFMWVGILLIFLVGVIHLIDAPGSFDDATYKGVLFVANVIGAALAVVGIAGVARWAWTLGLVVAGGSFVCYIVSRTIGLPGLDPDVWFEPLGILSLIVEGLFVGVAGWVLIQQRAIVR